MKWSYCLGNPPYQSETVERLSRNKWAPLGKMSFIISRWKLTKISEDGSILIYPGGRWIHQSGKGLQQFGRGTNQRPNIISD